MTTREYKNKNNGGTEKITRDGDRYTISSHTKSAGWFGPVSATKSQVKKCLEYTGAPDDVASDMLA